MKYTIRTVDEKDMLGIAKAHIKCFPDNFSTRLGPDLLSKYYLEYYNEQPNLFFVCENNNGDICGFVMGYIIGSSKAMSSFLSKYKIQMALRISLRLISFDRVSWKKVKSVLIKEKSKKNNMINDRTGQGDLLSICVTNELKGSGVAAKLVEQFHSSLIKLGISKCFLNCETENARGVAFYKKVGYSIDQESPEKIRFVKELI